VQGPAPWAEGPSLEVWGYRKWPVALATPFGAGRAFRGASDPVVRALSIGYDLGQRQSRGRSEESALVGVPEETEAVLKR
jgi:hypothetical protein